MEFVFIMKDIFIHYIYSNASRLFFFSFLLFLNLELEGWSLGRRYKWHKSRSFLDMCYK